MKKQIFFKILSAPAFILLVSVGIYYVFFMSNDYNIVQKPEGIYTHVDEEDVTPPSSPSAPTTQTPHTTPQKQSEPKQPSTPVQPQTTPPPAQKTTPKLPATPAPKSSVPAKQNPALYAKNSNLYDELAMVAKYSSPSLTLGYTTAIATACKNANAAGCYLTAQDKIWITAKFKTNESYRRDILAHEYMHYIWHHLGIGTAELRNVLNTKYAQSKELQVIIDDSYIVNGQVDPNEILAYSCTTLTKKQMGATIYNVCNKYLNLALLSPFINSNPTRFVGAFNYLREKSKLPGVANDTYLAKAAQAGLATVLKGNDLTGLQSDPNVSVNVQTACYVKQYHINTMQSSASDEVYMADTIIGSDRAYFLSKNITKIGVAIKKIPYTGVGTIPIFNNAKPLVNANVVMIISC